jgi:hypothetical protein
MEHVRAVLHRLVVGRLGDHLLEHFPVDLAADDHHAVSLVGVEAPGRDVAEILAGIHSAHLRGHVQHAAGVRVHLLHLLPGPLDDDRVANRVHVEMHQPLRVPGHGRQVERGGGERGRGEQGRGKGGRGQAGEEAVHRSISRKKGVGLQAGRSYDTAHREKVTRPAPGFQ